MISCTRRLQFCAGHRVYGHENKCANLHGHNYVAYIHALTDRLDSIGRVIDFGVLKKLVGGWIDINWDHGFILFVDDPLINIWSKELRSHKIFYLPSNPTAENLAGYLLNAICPKVLVSTGIQVRKVVLWETENCFATARLE